MCKKGILYIIWVVLLYGCLGLESENISDSISYQPDISLPLGKLLVEYTDIDDVPIIPPVDLTPVTYHEKDTVYFRVEENVAVRERILELMFQFDSKNRFPAAVEFRLYYWDDTNTDIYLTEEPITLPAAEIDATGLVVKESTDLTKLPLSDKQIDDILSVNRFVIEATIKDVVFTPEVVDQINTYSILSAVGVRAHVDFR